MLFHYFSATLKSAFPLRSQQRKEASPKGDQQTRSAEVSFGVMTIPRSRPLRDNARSDWPSRLGMDCHPR